MMVGASPCPRGRGEFLPHYRVARGGGAPRHSVLKLQGLSQRWGKAGAWRWEGCVEGHAERASGLHALVVLSGDECSARASRRRVWPSLLPKDHSGLPGTRCLSKAVPADAPRHGARDRQCVPAGMGQHESKRYEPPPPPPSLLQVLPLPPACSLAPTKLGAGMHRSPCCLPSSCSGVGGLRGNKSSPEEEKGIPCLPCPLVHRRGWR